MNRARSAPANQDACCEYTSPTLASDRSFRRYGSFAAHQSYSRSTGFSHRGSLTLPANLVYQGRNPFAILFANGSVNPVRIFRLWVEQGLWCLGCCWALMLVMFAVGVMNIFWMALIGLFTLIEKQTTGRLPTRLAGAILLVWAATLLVISL